LRPRALAAASPAIVRSRMISRSNWASVAVSTPFRPVTLRPNGLDTTKPLVYLTATGRRGVGNDPTEATSAPISCGDC